MSHWITSCAMAISCSFLLFVSCHFHHCDVLLVLVINRQIVKQMLVCLFYAEKVGWYFSIVFVCIFKAAYFNRTLEKTLELLLDF